MKPIIKWSGRKTYLINEIQNFIENKYKNQKFSYHEPFFGSGAIYFNLATSMNSQIEKSYLNDSIPELIIFYKTLQEINIDAFHENLIQEEKAYSRKHSYDSKSEVYTKWKDRFNTLINSEKIKTLNKKERTEVAKLFLLLNQACFNGVYRKNNKGEFNVPHGRTTSKDGIKDNKISIPMLPHLKEVASSLPKDTTSFTSLDYKDALKKVKPGDFVYLDPPYYDSVNYYDHKTFTTAHQEELRDEMTRLIKLGAHVVMSNSKSPECKKLYKSKYTSIKEIPVTRTMQRKKEKKGVKYKEDKKELLITSTRPLQVVELFAGVGGFRLGLEQDNKYEVIWSNQWEPNKKVQHASDVYIKNFGDIGHSNEDIEQVNTADIPNHEVLVGGFPCQDYSVASLLKNSKGLLGKKGVLWWSIHRILEEKEKKPNYLILENVDRLLKSPVNQKGRDFAVMLKSLNDLGYAVEWRVINAGEYGMPQKRKRVFILGYHKNSEIYEQLKDSYHKDKNAPNSTDWLFNTGVFAKSFKVNNSNQLFSDTIELDKDITQVSKNFNKKTSGNKFHNAGLMMNGIIETTQTIPKYEGEKTPLREIILTTKVDDEFYINDNDLKRWEEEKGSKKKTRIKDGFEYVWSEGKMSFPDDLNSPSRTIITSEGGSTPSRVKHAIKTRYGLRRLTPVELERLNMFPDNHTKLEGVSDNMRAFLMGNALVVGIVEKIGKEIAKRTF